MLTYSTRPLQRGVLFHSLNVLAQRRCYSAIKKDDVISIDGVDYKTDGWTNVPQSILDLTGRKLHLRKDHPIGILSNLIKNKFDKKEYTFYNNFKPVVTTFENFDVLDFPQDHVGRSKSDTYYINKDNLLRTHTSAHEYECFKETKTPGYFISADVYRRDEIDRTHYPAFHQMEGARIWKKGDIEQIKKDLKSIPPVDLVVEDVVRPFDAVDNPKQAHMTDEETDLVGQHLRRTCEVIVDTVFNEAKKAGKLAGSTDPFLNEPLKVRWVEAYFPWTAPSWEIEVWWKGEWLECLGCGVVRKVVLDNSGVDNSIGWAFGIGLDRIAMLLFGVPDIRLFWSLDERFSKQFKENTITNFVPYSKYPGTQRDISFWLPKSVENSAPFHSNDFFEIAREFGGDLIENVSIVDEFTHPKTGKSSKCYRINYQSMDKTLTNEQVNEINEAIRKALTERFEVELR
ncbi:phenylalanine--tRNA ligase [Saccharomycopsis crataegensis]|uniref:Phenylalanine--tRNA ligase, mitochondrial n=1 Tax=Saccharomycopsis crataegensis TaxID=43959 RepID=A0AAV5QMQ2_9ASCO|nr:phenylalanine--tRNA ligase [Saccharomycopsis crataegensis]